MHTLTFASVHTVYIHLSIIYNVKWCYTITYAYYEIMLILNADL